MWVITRICSKSSWIAVDSLLELLRMPVASCVPKPSSMMSVGNGAPARRASSRERAMRMAKLIRKASPPGQARQPACPFMEMIMSSASAGRSLVAALGLNSDVQSAFADARQQLVRVALELGHGGLDDHRRDAALAERCRADPPAIAASSSRTSRSALRSMRCRSNAWAASCWRAAPSRSSARRQAPVAGSRCPRGSRAAARSTLATIRASAWLPFALGKLQLQLQLPA